MAYFLKRLSVDLVGIARATKGDGTPAGEKFCEILRQTREKQMNRPKVISEAEWVVARKELLKKEKEFTHQRDALSAERRKLPWVKIDKEYVFDGPNGKETLVDLFDGRRGKRGSVLTF